MLLRLVGRTSSVQMVGGLRRNEVVAVGDERRALNKIIHCQAWSSESMVVVVVVPLLKSVMVQVAAVVRRESRIAASSRTRR